MRWPIPASRPEWLTPEQYAHAPDEIRLREVKVGHQVLVTTLLDHRRISKADLSSLYACCVPRDHVPIRSWPLFKARDVMRGVIEPLKAGIIK